MEYANLKRYPMGTSTISKIFTFLSFPADDRNYGLVFALPFGNGVKSAASEGVAS